MIKKILSIFCEKNSINEKGVIGFFAFMVMVLFALADITTGWLGKDLIVNEFIYNSFVMLCLGAFGFGSVDKYINKK